MGPALEHDAHVVEVPERPKVDVLLIQVFGEPITREDHICRAGGAAIRDTVADVDHRLLVPMVGQVMPLAVAAAVLALLTALGPQDGCPLGAEQRIVALDRQPLQPGPPQHGVDHDAESGRQYDHTMALGLCPVDQLDEPGAQRCCLLNEVLDVLGCRLDSAELQLHRVLEGDLTSTQPGFDLLPHLGRSILGDDQPEGVPLRDRAVEIAGDQQGIHPAAGYQNPLARRSRIYIVTPRAIAIIGQSSAERGRAVEHAEECGRLLARRGITVITGGLGGVMAAASRGAKAEGGLVVAVLPGIDPAAATPDADAVVCTGAGEGRNLAVVASGGAAIAIGGGWGTLSEIGLAQRLGREVVLLDTWGIEPPAGWEAPMEPVVASSPGSAVETAVGFL